MGVNRASVGRRLTLMGLIINFERLQGVALIIISAILSQPIAIMMHIIVIRLFSPFPPLLGDLHFRIAIRCMWL